MHHQACIANFLGTQAFLVVLWKMNYKTCHMALLPNDVAVFGMGVHYLCNKHKNECPYCQLLC